MNPLAHRRHMRHLDSTGGGKGYAYCGCCGAKVKVIARAVPAFRCACNDAGRCYKCSRCPDHCRIECGGLSGAN
jgi:hypothetical protein